MLERWIRFLSSDIWRFRIRDLPRARSLIIRPLRILVLALRGFDENKCGFRASALTYYSMLSVVPMLALAFGIAKGFNLDQRLRELIRSSILGNVRPAVTTNSGPTAIQGITRSATGASPDGGTTYDGVGPLPTDPFSGETSGEGSVQAATLSGGASGSKEPVAAVAGAQASMSESPQGERGPPGDFREEIVDRLIGFSDSLLQSARGDVIAGVGIILIFWIVVRVLGSVEDSFNDIWGIHRGRSLARRVSAYLSLLLVCPVFLIIASSLTVRVRVIVQSLPGSYVFLDPLARLLLFGIQLLPYFVIWILLGFIYMLLPNTKVSLKAAATGGIIAGTLFQIVQWAYIHFQVGVARNNAIYGSFAALPLFLVWVNLSWIVVLLGAEIAFAVDNEETYEFEKDARRASLRFRRLLALRIVQESVQRFCAQEPLPTASSLAHLLEAPIRLVREILHELVEARVLSEVADGEDPTETYQPARPVESLTLHRVLDTLDRRGTDYPGLVRSQELIAVTASLESLERRVAEAPENMLLRDL